MISDKVITVKELARRWRGLVVKRTIDNWRMLGRGPKYQKIGKGKTCLVLYKLKDIQKFEKSYFNGSVSKWRKLRSR